VLVRTDDDDGLAHLLHLDGGDDAGGGTAVDDEVVGFSGGKAERAEAEEREAEEHGG
jgi:hypothetical protein